MSTQLKAEDKRLPSTTQMGKKNSVEAKHGKNASCRPEDIARYFTKQEWIEMAEWEKSRYRNIKQNYEKTLEIGLEASKPVFMTKQRRIEPKPYSSGDSDEEWTPKLEATKENKRDQHITKAKWKNFFSRFDEDTGGMSHFPKERNAKQNFKESTKDEGCSAILNDSSECEAEESSNSDLAASRESSSVGENMKEDCNRTHSLRNRKPVMYTEMNELQDDDYLYCEECQSFFLNQCEVHGSPIFIADSIVELGTNNRAKLTLPPALSVRISGIPNAGLGVWNEGPVISIGTHFGPYEGVATDDNAKSSGYAWMIIKGKDHYKYIEGEDEKYSNWMRYVNCARYEEEQNLIAFQYHQNIYYRACRDILSYTELLVWYGEDYGMELGIRSCKPWKQKTTPKVQINWSHSHPCQRYGEAVMDANRISKHRQPHHPLPAGQPGEEQPSSQNLSVLQDGSANHAGAGRDRRSPSSSMAREPAGKLAQTRSRDDKPRPAPATERPHVCEQCGKVFTCSAKLNQHCRIHTGEKPYVCEECGKRYTCSANLNRHCRLHTGEKPYVCEQCGKVFTCSENLNRHCRLHTGEKPYVCEEYGKRYTCSANLNRHCRLHTGEKPYVCEQCGKGYTCSGDLTRHCRVHTGEKPYVCEECGKRYTCSANLNRHCRLHTGEKPYVCEQCGKGYTCSGDLTRHCRVHTGEKPYVCEECGKGYVRSWDLKKHCRIHTGEKPYVCEQCGKGFTRSETLTIHCRVHTGEKPYVCEQCGKGYTCSGELTRHCRFHTGQKPYVCEDCGKGYTCSGDLTRHCRLHTGEKPYVCEQCGKGYTRSGQLKVHYRVHTGEKPYVCDK
ncbi:histone-lysine N-methyltransferase PRDM9-like [Hyperolius riggenbachi]|uniref:histone-lysine N-methyltransferase PRDM9-like n=1 Tax=Hyperolius riggenbachi TaxID=752182 RepID=UPI0035A37E11